MGKNRSLILLIGITFLACVLRFAFLDALPPSLHRDEAFLGYNAFSLLKTGKDMTGDFLPLHLRAFLYSPAGYAYFSIPSIALVGLNAFSVRFPSALFGSLTVLALYFLTKELLRKSKYQEHIAILSSFLLAITPWHITLSRVATENVLVTFFLVIGVWLYLLWIRKKTWGLFALSFLSFITTIGIYQAPRAFLPLFLPIFFLLYVRDLGRKRFFLSILLFAITIIIPVCLILVSPQLSLRIKTLSLTQNSDTLLTLGEQAHQESGYVPLVVTRMFHNKPFYYGSEFLQNYFSHFSYDFLFTDQGLPDRYRVPLTGLLFVWEIPLFLVGFWLMVKKQKTSALLLLVWTLLAPVGSALTTDDVPNLQRTLFMVTPLCIFTSYGVLGIYTFLKQKLWQISFVTLFGFLTVFGLSYYLLQYSVHEPLYRPWYRMDGYRELVQEVNKLLPNYPKAVVTNRESAPAIFFLFYSQYDPALFQKETRNTLMHDYDRIGFSKYKFSQEECPLQLKTFPDGTTMLTGQKGILYVDSGTCKIPPDVSVLKRIQRHDNSPVFLITKVK